VTAINIGAMITKILKNEQIIFVDINKYCKDIENYLSDAHFTKGLDDFINLHNSGLLSRDSFETCVKKLKFNIDIMAAHRFFEVTEDNIKALMEYANEIYKFAIIDTISGDNRTSEMFFEKSNAIIVVLNPIKSVVKLIDEIEGYKKHKERVIFVVNRYFEKYDYAKLEYQVTQIKKEIRDMGFDSPVFTLDFNLDLINECNYGSILNFVLGTRIEDVAYTFQMEKIVEYIFRKHTNYVLKEKVLKRKKSAAKRWVEMFKKYKLKLIRRYFMR
jgi:MinD-like ATPase involved in chromosome partitioning or flagellar assembly